MSAELPLLTSYTNLWASVDAVTMSATARASAAMAELAATTNPPILDCSVMGRLKVLAGCAIKIQQCHDAVGQ